MNRVRLGKSELMVSPVGIGTYQATSNWGSGDQGVIDALRASLESGVNFIDTAEEYGRGHSEEVVRAAIKGVRRDEVVIATKVFGSHLRFEELQKSFAASARRLGVKDIDLFQVHWPDPREQVPLRHTMRALEKLKSEGKVGAIGVSNFSVRDLEEARALLPRSEIVSNQVRYNLLQRDVEEEVVPYCRKEGITILPWGPLAQGILSGRYSRRRLPPSKARRANPLYSAHNMREAQKVLRVLRRISAKHRASVAQVAICWLSKGKETVPIVGATSSEQARQNAQAPGLDLSEEELWEVEEASDSVRLDYFVA